MHDISSFLKLYFKISCKYNKIKLMPTFWQGNSKNLIFAYSYNDYKNNNTLCYFINQE